jgi:hypothetical protein
MDRTRTTLAAAGAAAALGTIALLSQAPTHAFSNGNGNGSLKDVIVVNAPSQPVPVAGQIGVDGPVAVTGSVGSLQSGPWTVGIDPSHNLVSVAGQSAFYHDDGFAAMNDGETVDLGPFDVSDVATLRILARAVNGDVTFEILTDVAPAFPIRMDLFTLGGEGGSVSGTRVYEAPPRSVIVRVTESGPGGANYHVVLAGH